MGLLSVDEVVSRAIADAGSDDFGPGDFLDGLTHNLAAFAQMPLTEQALGTAMAGLVSALATRIRVQAWHEAHPQAAAQDIEGPVLVCGMPRTGTTATVQMLAHDDRFRTLRAWEGQNPLPPPVAHSEAADPRRLAAVEAGRCYAKADQHIHDPDGPNEDLVFWASYSAHAFHGPYPMPQGYYDWWLGADFDTVYADFRRMMTLLQSSRPPHLWLMKAPPHLAHLDAFARAFPNARYVWTHRDPVKIIPSCASVHHRFYVERVRPGSIDKHATGRTVLQTWERAVARGLAAREAIGEECFIDVKNDDVVHRPLETFERIYAHLGMDLTPDVRACLATFAEINKPGSRGAHTYSAEEYGVTDDQIRASFKDYIGRFSI
jgi:hypothetical protein